MHRITAHATTSPVTMVSGQIAGAGPATDAAGGALSGAAASGAAADWEAIRAQGDIQYAPVNFTPTAPKTPDWLKAVSEFLRDLFGPVGEGLSSAWPILKWGLLIGIVLLALLLIWRLLSPVLRIRRDTDENVESWTPDRGEALALLDDADRLAALGRYDEATHLLLQRSVGQILAARPGWLDPSSTAREIAALPALPERARAAFGTIAQRVERSLFALRGLALEDWQLARAAYAEFALADLSISDVSAPNLPAGAAG